MWAELLLVVHCLWATWMIAGVLVALVGFVWPRVWGWRIFRTLHVLALAGTASVPLWADRGLCPLTLWEWQLAHRGDGPQSFLARLISDILYLDVDPTVLTLFTGTAAVLTVAMYILRPPWRYGRH